MKKIALVGAVVVFFGAAACGQSAEAPKAEQPVEPVVNEPVQQYNESDILNHLGAVEKNGLTYVILDDGTECEIAVVMTDRDMVAMYANAGDVTAANADGSAGVKIVAPEAATCQTALVEQLSDFGNANMQE